MKKKLIFVIALILSLSVLFSACSVIQLNEQRQGEKVVAEITYTCANGRVLKREVTRFQLITAANQNAQQWYNYYGSLPEWLTMERLYNDTLEELCDYQFTVLNGIDYISMVRAGVWDSAGNKWNGQPYDVLEILSGYSFSGETLSYVPGKSILNKAEINRTIKNTNAQYESVFASYLKTVEAEQKAIEDKNNEETNPTEEEPKKLTPRPVKTEAAEADFDPDEQVEEFAARYTDKIDKYIGIEDPEGKSNAEEIEKNNKNRRDAWNRTEKAFKDNYITYDYLFKDSLDGMLIYEFKRELSKGAVSDEDIDARLQKIVSQNKNAYAKTKGYDGKYKASDIRTAFDSSYDGIFWLPSASEGDFYVKNLLIKFGSVADSYVQELKKRYTDYNTSADFQKAIDELAKGLKANVSNIFYKDSASETKPYYKAEEDFFSKNLVFTEADWAIVQDYKDRKILEKTNEEIILEIRQALSQGKHNVLFLLGASDPNKAYIVEGLDIDTILGLYKSGMDGVASSGSYASSYEHTKALLETFDMWFYALNDDAESSFNKAVDYLVYDDVGFVKPFKEYAKALYNVGSGVIGASGGIGNYKTAPYSVGSYTSPDGYFVVSEYGIHIMLVTYAPYSKDEESGFGGTKIGDDLILGLDHILGYYKDEAYTVKQYITKLIEEERATTAYYVKQREILNAKDGHYKTDPKRYKDLIK